MGCHTWFYKKWNVSKDEAKSKLIEIIDDSIILTERCLFSPTEEDEEFFSYHPECDEKKLLLELNDYEIFRDNILNLSDDEIFEAFADKCLKVCRYVKDKGLFIYDRNENLPHDLFRKYGYPDDTLHSLEETLSYISDVNNGCQVFDYTKEGLIKFWNEFPDGMITFG